MTLVLPLGLALGLALALIPVGILLAFVVVVLLGARLVVVVTHLIHLAHPAHSVPLRRSRDSQQGSDEECRAQEFQFLHRSLLKWYAYSHSQAG